MNATILKVVVLASTVGMVLPTGWCCVTSHGEAAVATAKSPVAQRPCCQRRQMQRSADCGSIPGRPNLRCCCQRDAAIPVKRVQQSVAPAIVLPLAVFHLALPIGPSLEWSLTGWTLGEGPPLNLLKCVWRC